MALIKICSHRLKLKVFTINKQYQKVLKVETFRQKLLSLALTDCFAAHFKKIYSWKNQITRSANALLQVQLESIVPLSAEQKIKIGGQIN